VGVASPVRDAQYRPVTQGPLAPALAPEGRTGVRLTVDSAEDWTRDALLATATELREAAGDYEGQPDRGDDPALPVRMRSCADELEALVATGYWGES
jgi:hypothetical protein